MLRAKTLKSRHHTPFIIPPGWKTLSLTLHPKGTDMLPFISIVILEFLLVLICCLGDYHLQHPVAKQKVVVVIGDSLTHGIVAGISWAIVCDLRFKRQEILQCMLCVVLAMLVDIDHFISAGSFSLKAALSLPARPPFHASTLIVIVDVVMIILAAIFKSQNIILGAMIFTTAWFSHHVRDGYRRGLWFYPFGETLPVSRTVYLGTIMIFPLLIKFFYFYLIFKNRVKDKRILLEETQNV